MRARHHGSRCHTRVARRRRSCGGGFEPAAMTTFCTTLKRGVLVGIGRHAERRGSDAARRPCRCSAGVTRRQRTHSRPRAITLPSPNLVLAAAPRRHARSRAFEFAFNQFALMIAPRAAYSRRDMIRNRHEDAAANVSRFEFANLAQAASRLSRRAAQLRNRSGMVHSRERLSCGRKHPSERNIGSRRLSPQSRSPRAGRGGDPCHGPRA